MKNCCQQFLVARSVLENPELFGSFEDGLRRSMVAVQSFFALFEKNGGDEPAALLCALKVNWHRFSQGIFDFAANIAPCLWPSEWIARLTFLKPAGFGRPAIADDVIGLTM